MANEVSSRHTSSRFREVKCITSACSRFAKRLRLFSTADERRYSVIRRLRTIPEIKIALYGGTTLDARNIELVQRLALAFLTDPHVILVSGGIYDPNLVNVSVDLAAYRAAKSYVKKTKQHLKKRFQTWLPETKRPGIDRKAWGTSKTLHGSPRSRRFQIVNEVDAIVTVEGEGQTKTVLELAMALGRVALPIGFTGTDSSEFWETDRSFFERTLDLDISLAKRLDHRPSSDEEMTQFAEDVALAVLKKARRRCLVLMDFNDDEHEQFFRNVVTPAVTDAGFAVHKLDEQESAGDILNLFLARLYDCHAIIVDLTGPNQNVLYELGRVHQHGDVQPLIILRKENQKLPYYVSRSLVSVVGDDNKYAYDVIGRHLIEDRRRP